MHKLGSSMLLFTIQSNVSYLLNTFASNETSLIFKSKSSTTTTNLPSFNRTTANMQKIEIRIYQNEFDNKQMK